MKTIEVVISPSGESRLETKGFDGPSCRTASELLERALGTATGEQLTSEFHTNNSVSQTQHQQGA